MTMEKRSLASQYLVMQEVETGFNMLFKEGSFLKKKKKNFLLLIHSILVFLQILHSQCFPARVFPLYPNLAKLDVLDFFSPLCLHPISL